MAIQVASQSNSKLLQDFPTAPDEPGFEREWYTAGTTRCRMKLPNPGVYHLLQYIAAMHEQNVDNGVDLSLNAMIRDLEDIASGGDRTNLTTNSNQRQEIFVRRTQSAMFLKDILLVSDPTKAKDQRKSNSSTAAVDGSRHCGCPDTQCQDICGV